MHGYQQLASHWRNREKSSRPMAARRFLMKTTVADRSDNKLHVSSTYPFKRLYISVDMLSPNDNLADFIITGLDAAATDPKWLELMKSRKQLELF